MSEYFWLGAACGVIATALLWLVDIYTILGGQHRRDR